MQIQIYTSINENALVDFVESMFLSITCCLFISASIFAEQSCMCSIILICAEMRVILCYANKFLTISWIPLPVTGQAGCWTLQIRIEVERHNFNNCFTARNCSNCKWTALPWYFNATFSFNSALENFLSSEPKNYI